ncbi:hypothetical protein MTR67_032389 [Solanum verrucosum]|uniref:Uncharacterized protein n=1 Tax=Solanum verrucosum TaxID=315347 RepID=A0AAF0ZJ30_SOLVR|nr:hypothetical protein MTR67_032389 [Solanum verrucosum]
MKEKEILEDDREYDYYNTLYHRSRAVRATCLDLNRYAKSVNYLLHKVSLLSIALAPGKPIDIDKETQEKSRPNTTRVEVDLDLLAKLPQRMKLQLSTFEVDHPYLVKFSTIESAITAKRLEMLNNHVTYVMIQ